MNTSNLLLACAGAFALSVSTWPCMSKLHGQYRHRIPTRAYRCAWEVVRRALSAGVGDPYFESVCSGCSAFESPNSDRAVNQVPQCMCVLVMTRMRIFVFVAS